MKSYVIQGAFGIDNLTEVDRPDPAPGPGQVLMKVRATSINYRDLLMVKGGYNPKQPLPLIPFSDGAGEIVAVGDGVTRVKVGDRVTNTFFHAWTGGKPKAEEIGPNAMGGPRNGMLTQHIVLSEQFVVKFPDHLSFEEAATLPCAALTAWSCLFRHGNLKPGETVLVLGTGGVSIAGLQLAKAAGATVIITSSSDEKLARAKALGADHGVNYKKEEAWSKAVRAATGGAGVDHVIEVGGVGTLEQSIRSCRMAGTVSLVGILAGAQSPLNLTAVLMQDIRIQGVFVGPRESFEDMNRAIATHQIKPVVDKVFPWKDAREALRCVESGSHFGKVCISVNA